MSQISVTSPRVSVRRRLLAGLAVLSTLALVGPMLRVSVAEAVQVHQPVVVSDNPANFTPNVLDGSVKAIAQVGNQIVIGGNFTQIQAAGSTTTLTRTHIAAFNATTGAISTTFVPQVNGAVEALVAAPDGQSVFVGGRFTRVNGAVQPKVARLSIAGGQRVAGFRGLVWNGIVKDMKLHPNGNLIVGGNFTTVGGFSRTTLASLSAATGVVTPFLNHNVVTTRTGARQVIKMDLSSNGAKLAVIGNFTSVDGYPRSQLAVLNTSGPTSAVAFWQTDFYTSACAAAFDTYMRDLDIDPTGTYLVVSTTGAYRGPESACDTISRFELNRVERGIVPTWRAYTGGDTTYAVVSTGNAIYAGGHFRWLNNPFAGDTAGPGAIPREGIAALDPRTGLPYSWNPGRARGVGVFDLVATSQGLWVGNDTTRIGGEVHRRIALMPLAGGTAPPPDRTGQLPTQVVQLGTGFSDNARSMQFGGATPPTGVTPLGGGVGWSAARGAFQVDSTLYAGWSNLTFTKRSFDGTTFGPASTIPLAGSSFANDMLQISAMAYARRDGRLYYTMYTGQKLFWRHFTPESGAVGAARFAASGDVAALAPNRVRGMFLSGNRLYFADSTDGRLRWVTLANAVVSGPVTLADASTDWRSRGLVIRGNDATQGNPLIP